MELTQTINVSPLEKTWILDLDGTLVKHNGYKIDGEDTLLDGVEKLLSQISTNDYVIIITSRTEKYKEMTIKFLNSKKIHYDQIIFGVPYGERILINDKKTSGLTTAISVNTQRDKICETQFIVNPNY